MNISLIGVPLAAVTLAVAAAGLAQAAEPLQPYPVKGQVIQRLNAFDNPDILCQQRNLNGRAGAFPKNRGLSCERSDRTSGDCCKSVSCARY